MHHCLFALLLGFGASTAFAADSPAYRAYIYEVECKDLSGPRSGLAEWQMGLKFLAIDVYVELEKMGFKYVTSFLRAESMAKVQEFKLRNSWMKANKAKYKSDSDLIAAVRAAVPDESVGRYVQQLKMLDLKELCTCYNREKLKQAPNAEEYARKQAALTAAEPKMKATCVKAAFKSENSWPW